MTFQSEIFTYNSNISQDALFRREANSCVFENEMFLIK